MSLFLLDKVYPPHPIFGKQNNKQKHNWSLATPKERKALWNAGEKLKRAKNKGTSEKTKAGASALKEIVKFVVKHRKELK